MKLLQDKKVVGGKEGKQNQMVAWQLVKMVEQCLLQGSLEGI